MASGVMRRSFPPTALRVLREALKTYVDPCLLAMEPARAGRVLSQMPYVYVVNVAMPYFSKRLGKDPAVMTGWCWQPSPI